VVDAPYYSTVSEMMMVGVKQTLDASKASFDYLAVPGALEVPTGIWYALRAHAFDAMRRRYEGFIALGCVLKGETRHHEIVGDLSAKSLQELSIRYTLALSNGILTCDTLDQAMERANPEGRNRGAEVAHACLRMIELKEKFGLRAAKRRWQPTIGRS
ncbi:MAG: 6,7-dimethyl-8-ribityllumazine synthase, partial [Alphaproteobacteria bacterium]|nr:6,7-dimethyl-8-ribityllumazine synthase [Alphaproteobacteria bacterium]